MDTSTVALFALPVLLQVAAYAVMWAYYVGRYGDMRCPDCGGLLPLLYRPWAKTRRMWRAGGWLCPRCGCESDLQGRKVTADTLMPAAPVRAWAAVGLLAATGVGILVGGYVLSRAAVAAPLAVAAAPAER